ncbi:hypothetical protein GCM10008090_00530 [Arenicella chitinivorans]|uniref:Uncharacterized protein n=2 Tax=Arenicella chitinivorans TaxID=1329800 RepID=A0A918RIK3_9GAMM|nr:hypothetical protein GCM10008090_00530 [Arenicella chitinivorans]
MVNLFFEIKRNLPPELGDDLKISSADLSSAMINVYWSSDDNMVRTLVEAFFRRAGDEWYVQLQPKKRYYRGVEIAENRAHTQSKSIARPDSDKPKAKKRFYRGALVE